MKTIFAISDIHGHYSEMISDLYESGYDKNDPNHLLVVCGDIFDRGRENLEVYEYLKGLTDKGKAIVIAGNHNKFLIEYLDGTNISPFNYMENGTNETLADFLHETSPFETWCFFNEKTPTYGAFATWIEIARNMINEEYPELLGWLKSLPRYYETENYIFAHASLDLKSPNWREPHCEKWNLVDWDALDFDDGNFVLKNNNTGKSIVVGHFDTGHLRQMHKMGKYEDHSILETADNKIFIDGCVPLTKKVNVLVLQKEQLLKK